jgi:hypothetical protein
MKLVAMTKGDQNRAALDPWTVVHLSAGLALGLMDLPLGRCLAAALAYEVAEQYAERRAWAQGLFETEGPESLSNAVVDVLAFSLGHWVGSTWNRTG